MPEQYYLDKLYPIQDEILQLVQDADVDFYLTGGTALSRFHLQHRYSDDLDFFVNQPPDYKNQVERIINLFHQRQWEITISTTSDSFLRMSAQKNQIPIKIDFINDVPFHYGAFIHSEQFQRIDNWRNILSNKICALSRHEPKDIADILFTAFFYPFDWEEVMQEAREKDLWVEPIEISKIINEFPSALLQPLKWIKPVNISMLQEKLKILHTDIFYGNSNSLVFLK
jgi:hypothetical protein